MKQPSIVPLNIEKHKKLKIKQDNTFAFAAKQHLVAVTMRELAGAASAMPVIFIKSPQTNDYHFAAITGIEPEQNLFRQDEKWMINYVPWNLQRFPFDMRGSLEKVNVYFDENSDLVGAEEGHALFDEEGKITPFFDNVQKLLGALAESEVTGRKLIQLLVEYDLLHPILIHVTYATGEQKNLVGMHAINEEKLNSLDDESILSLMRSGGLGVIYTLIQSIYQLNRLVELSATTDKPVINLQVIRDEKAVEQMISEQASQDTSAPAKEEKKPAAKKTTRKKAAEK